MFDRAHCAWVVLPLDLRSLTAPHSSPTVCSVDRMKLAGHVCSAATLALVSSSTAINQFLTACLGFTQLPSLEKDSIVFCNVVSVICGIFDNSTNRCCCSPSAVSSQGEVLLWHKENGLETLEAVQYIEVLEAEVKRLRLQLDQQQQQPEQLKLAQPATPAQQQPSIPQVAPAVLQPDTRQLPVPFSAAPHAIKVGRGEGALSIILCCRQAFENTVAACYML